MFTRSIITHESVFWLNRNEKSVVVCLLKRLVLFPSHAFFLRSVCFGFLFSVAFKVAQLTTKHFFLSHLDF